jgi:hypothetical protein
MSANDASEGARDEFGESEVSQDGDVLPNNNS